MRVQGVKGKTLYTRVALELEARCRERRWADLPVIRGYPDALLPSLPKIAQGSKAEGGFQRERMLLNPLSHRSAFTKLKNATSAPENGR